MSSLSGSNIYCFLHNLLADVLLEQNFDDAVLDFLDLISEVVDVEDVADQGDVDNGPKRVDR